MKWKHVIKQQVNGIISASKMHDIKDRRHISILRLKCIFYTYYL